MVTSSVVFDHRGRAGKGAGPVEIRLTVERKSYYVNTGVQVLRSDFVGGSVVNRTDCALLNERIRIVNDKLMAAVNECLANEHPIDMVAIRKRIWNTSSRSSTAMIDWVCEQLPLLGLREGTLKHYNTLVVRLRNYGEMLGWGDVTVENIYRFDAWLHSQRRWNGEPISDAAVYNYHKCFKALMQRALRHGIISVNPYDRLRGQFKRGDKATVEYLTEDEMQRIMALQFEPGSMIDRAKDLFIFQMFTGLSYGDSQAFDFSKYRMEDGAWTYIGERMKTGVPYVSRLLPPAVQIVEKYNGDVPKIGNADYNHLLKGIGAAANIHAPLHSHMARHTFATWMLNNGVSLDSVSVMVGHTNTVQTRRYAKTLAQTVKNDFDKIADRMKNALSSQTGHENTK